MATETCNYGGAVARNDEIVSDIQNNNEESIRNDVDEEEMYNSFEQDEELDEILEELEDPTEPMEPSEREAIMEFAEAKQKNKYLYDGQNLIHIKPQTSSKRKAVIGKAVWLHKKIVERMSTMKATMIEKAVGIYSGDLVDYIPKTGPQIPPLIYHCVKEIERREPVTRSWIYATPGVNRQINKVKRRFMRGTLPNLQKYDVHVLAGAITAFLREIREPLIPSAKWSAFTQVSSIPCKKDRADKLKELIETLPTENRTTLGFLIRHIQVMVTARYSKLSLGSASSVFGPIILGFSNSQNECAESPMVTDVMMGMLNIEPEFFGCPIE